jgi:predicted alpha/beta-fold hydrolase
VRTIRAFDGLTVVRRFGFRDADDYYDRSSVARRLGNLHVPAFLVAAEGDPMITARSIRKGLAMVPHDLRVEWVENGGHVGFSPALNLGQDAPLGIESQVLGWLAAFC